MATDLGGSQSSMLKSCQIFGENACHPFASREAQALSASEGSLAGQRAFAGAQDDTPEAASLTGNTSSSPEIA